MENTCDRAHNQQFSKGAMVQLIIGRRMTTTYYEINYIGNYGAVISMRGVIHLLTDHRDGSWKKITKVNTQEVAGITLSSSSKGKAL